MGSSSSRIGSGRSSEPSRINRTKRKLSSLLLCGFTSNSSSHPSVIEVLYLDLIIIIIILLNWCICLFFRVDSIDRLYRVILMFCVKLIVIRIQVWIFFSGVYVYLTATSFSWLKVMDINLFIIIIFFRKLEINFYFFIAVRECIILSNLLEFYC